jgi:hypothetical protein
VTAGLFLLMGVMLILLALFASVILGTVSSFVATADDPDATFAAGLIGLTGVGMAVVLGALAVPCMLAGWGLTKRRRWARIVGIVVAAISLVKFPIGTAFGAYALWVLLSQRTEVLFQSGATTSA